MLRTVLRDVTQLEPVQPVSGRIPHGQQRHHAEHSRRSTGHRPRPGSHGGAPYAKPVNWWSADIPKAPYSSKRPQWPDGTYTLTATYVVSGVHTAVTVSVGNGLPAFERLQSDYHSGHLSIDDFVYYSLLLGLNLDGVPQQYTDGAPAGTLPDPGMILNDYAEGLSQAGAVGAACTVLRGRERSKALPLPGRP
jgi:hypothetical protein